MAPLPLEDSLPPEDASPARLLGLASYYLRAGQLERGRRFLEAARDLGLDELRVRLAFGRLAILEGDAEAAVEQLEAAREIDPFDEEVSDLLGQLLDERGE